MEREQRLLRHGFALYTLGLLTRVIADGLENPRMGVAAHVEGVVNAIFLIVLGAAWSRLGLRGRAATWANWAGIVGAYANWSVPLCSQPFLLRGTGAEGVVRVSIQAHGSLRRYSTPRCSSHGTFPGWRVPIIYPPIPPC